MKPLLFIVEKTNDILKIIYSYSNLDFLQNNEDFDTKNDLIDCLLNLVETYTICLPKQFESEVDKLMEVSLSLVAFDPNYDYNNQNQGEGYGGYDDYDYYVNDDDSSWKVRRSAVKVLVTFIKARLNLSKTTMSEIIHHLTKRLIEHSENVKVEIIICLGLYLKNFVVEEQSSEGNTLILYLL